MSGDNERSEGGGGRYSRASASRVIGGGENAASNDDDDDDDGEESRRRPQNFRCDESSAAGGDDDKDDDVRQQHVDNSSRFLKVPRRTSKSVRFRIRGGGGGGSDDQQGRSVMTSDTRRRVSTPSSVSSGDCADCDDVEDLDDSSTSVESGGGTRVIMTSTVADLVNSECSGGAKEDEDEEAGYGSDESSVPDLAADPAVAASNIRRVRSLYSKSSDLRIVKRGATALAQESGKRVAFGDQVGGGEDALLRPATAEINARQRFFHKCATRSQSVPSASGGLPRVTISDFSSIDLSEMYEVLPPGAASTAAYAAAEPTEIDYVTLEDVAPFKPHYRRRRRSSTIGDGGDDSGASGESGLQLSSLIPASFSQATSSTWSAVSPFRLCDDTFSYTNSSIGTGDSIAAELLCFSPEPTDAEEEAEDVQRKTTRKPSGWRKLRSMVQWTPFIQTYKHRKYQWVQLAGHSGNFKAGQRQGTVMKKLCASEEECYKRLHGDALEAFVPEYQGTLEVEDEESKSKQKFIQLQDCLSSFTLPSVMDCKIGVRTYLEEELAKAKEKQKLRKDMYEKMIAVDPEAPSAKEHEWKGVTKPRYMVWRETISSTATLGFRIEGVKKSDGSSSKDFKTTKAKEDILKAFKNFISGSTATAQQYLERLVQIRRELNTSEFFKTHELIGSSLLFVHDSQKSGVWLIDFGKTVSVPEGLSIDHKSPWDVGNHEDGYLIGIENLILLFKDLVTMLEGEDKDDSKSNNQKDSEEKPIVDASSAQN